MKVVERGFEHRIRQQMKVGDKQFGFMPGKCTRVPLCHGKSWNLGRPFSRHGKTWKIAKVMESHGK